MLMAVDQPRHDDATGRIDTFICNAVIGCSDEYDSVPVKDDGAGVKDIMFLAVPGDDSAVAYFRNHAF
jgi:hypothetical protein